MGPTYQIQGKYNCQNRTLLNEIERFMFDFRSIHVRFVFDSHSIPVRFNLKMFDYVWDKKEAAL